jgi:hypothetical protein
VCEWLDVVVNSIESVTLTNLTTRSKEAEAQVQLSLHDNALNCILDTSILTHVHARTLHARRNMSVYSVVSIIYAYITTSHLSYWIYNIPEFIE